MKLQTLKKLSAWPLRRKLLVAEALLALVVAVVRVRFTPFRKLALRLGVQGREAPQQLSVDHANLARDTEWLIAAICRRLPWRPTCLMQAAAAKAMLGRHGVPATLYIGVSPVKSDRPVNAHAWLQCGQRIVTGKHEAKNFQPMAWFG